MTGTRTAPNKTFKSALKVNIVRPRSSGSTPQREKIQKTEFRRFNSDVRIEEAVASKTGYTVTAVLYISDPNKGRAKEKQPGWSVI